MGESAGQGEEEQDVENSNGAGNGRGHITMTVDERAQGVTGGEAACH